ncbi:MAG TPA: hypothetical protein VMV81_07765 [Phycisphaerae bacterium]|nr:hypothetical protein [Phycisphaerae bacterium]
MAAEPIILNPIGWVNARLLGGLRRTLAICGVYFVAAWLLLLMIYRAVQDGTTFATFAGGAYVLFVFIQAAVLFLGGANAVRRAIHRDFTTDMINSHRLTAMSGPTAVLGYLTGPTIQVVGLTFTTWLICSILAVLSATPSTTALGPTVALAISCCGALLMWTLTLLAAMSTRGKFSIIGLVAGVTVASNIQIAYLLPAVPLLLPTGVISLIRGTGVITAEMGMIVGMMAQLALSFALFLGASRRYTRDDVPAYRGRLAYALLALFALIAGVGFYFVPDENARLPFVAPRIVFRTDVEMVATLICLLLVALVPVAAAARDSALWTKRKAKDPHFTRPAPRPFYESAIISTLIITSVLGAVLNQRIPFLAYRPELNDQIRLALIPAILMLALLTLSAILRFCYSITSKAGWVVTLVIVLLWLIPMFADLSLEALTGSPSYENRTALFTSSPIGAWIASITDVRAPLLPGVCVQAFIAILALALSRRALPRRLIGATL